MKPYIYKKGDIMEKEYKKFRKNNKINSLPNDIKKELDIMLSDTSNTYIQISQYLKDNGYDISKSSVGRYALQTHKLSTKLLEARSQVNELVRLAKEGKDSENITEGAMQIATVKLTEKIAYLEEEIEEMDASDAIKLITSISRTKAYKDKIYAKLKSEYEEAYKNFKNAISEELKSHPDLLERLIKITDNTVSKL
jgi:hypothetical protein